MATRAARTLCILALCIATLSMVGPIPARAAPDDLAVIIVNQDYGAQAPAVKYALRDGAAFAKAATDVLGVPEGRVKTYANRTTGQLRRLLAPDGEIAGLMRGRPKGRLFLFYSGHGVPIDGVGYLLPVDVPPEAAKGDAFPIPKLRDDLLEMIGAEGQVVLFLDACFSGRSGDGGTIVRGASAGGPFNVAGSLARHKRAAVVAAARGDQVAWWDEPIAGAKAKSREHGIFTDTLIDALYAAARSGRKELALADLEGVLARRMAERLGALFPGMGRTQLPDVSAEPSFTIAGLATGGRGRDPVLTRQEATRCQTLGAEDDASEITAFLADCRTCDETCRTTLGKRVASLQSATEACRVEGAEVKRHVSRGAAARGPLTVLSKSAECPAARAEAAAVLARLDAGAQAALAKEKADAAARETEVAANRQALTSAPLAGIKISSHNQVPQCVTPSRLMAFAKARNSALDPRFETIAIEYKKHGERLGVRWDYAFFQMLVETDDLSFMRVIEQQGPAAPTMNNFAGLDTNQFESFPDIATGVLAHLQHVLIYAGERIESPVAERTRKVQAWGILNTWQKEIRGQVTFTHLAHRWSVNGAAYATAIEAVAKRFHDVMCSPPRLSRDRPTNLRITKGSDPARGVTPGSGQSFKDRLANGAECAFCPELVVVPAGSFVMGSPASEQGRDDSEGPQRTVTMRQPFAVGKYEVTFDEWDACVSAGGCTHRPGDRQRGRRAVIYVAWEDARQYVAWLSRMTGKGYRLLTEAEWEYAARATSRSRYHFGDSESQLGQHAWSNANSSTWPQPVGQKRPNGWGLHDMHGNVWEWVEDCWHNSYVGAPADGTAWTTGCTETARVLRGGASGDAPQHLRSAVRLGLHPAIRSASSNIGFRLARTIGGPAEGSNTGCAIGDAECNRQEALRALKRLP